MIAKKQKKPYIEVDLTGPQGNAFYLLGLASDLCNKFELDKAQVHKEMTLGDYENLVSTFDRYFGTMVVLYR